MLPASVKSAIDSLLQKAENSNMVSSCKSVMKMLTEHGLVFECKVHSKYIGVHPSNRDGFGVSGNAVASLASQIYHLGFDFGEIRAIAVEIDDASRDQITQFNKQMCAGSSETLAPVDVALKFASLQGSHTNQVLKAIHYGVKHADESMTEAGFLSVSKIGLRDPLFAQAVKEGLSWTIISTEAIRIFPSLPGLIQASGNAAGQVAQGEHEVQTMRKVLNAWYTEKGLLPEGHLVDFTRVRARVMASANAHAETIPWMYSFLLKYGGGKDSEYLKETEGFVRQHCSMNVKLGAAIYQAISSDCKVSTSPLINLRHAIIRFAYLSNSVNKAEVTKLFTTSDKDVQAKVAKCEQLMVDCRQTLKGCSANGDALMNAFQTLGTEMVKLLLGRKSMRKKYDHLESIAHDFVEEVSSICGRAIDSPYKQFAVAPEPTKELSSSSTANKHTHLDMTEVTADGRVADVSRLLLAAGFTLGAHIRRADSTTAILVAVEGEKVRLSLNDSAFALMDIPQFLKEQWIVYTPKAGPELVDACKLIAGNCVEYSAQVMKARILLELDALTIKYQKLIEGVQVFNKPKSVQVSSAWQKGQLVIVPTTTRISHKLGDMTIRVSDHLYINGGMDDAQFWLTAPPSSDAGFVAPFWSVQVTNEADKANMELIHAKTVIDKLFIPVYKNTVKLSPGDVLMVYKKIEKKQRFKDLTSDVVPGASSANEHKKRQKRGSN